LTSPRSRNSSGARGGTSKDSPPREPATEYSRRDRGSRGATQRALLARWGVLALGLAGGILLVVSDFTTLFEVTAITTVLPDGARTGGEQHSYAMLVLGVGALMMVGLGGLALASGVAPARPAMLALAGLGAIALIIALVGDLPAVSSSGLVKDLQERYDEAEGQARTGFWLELVGAALCLVAGGAQLLLGPVRSPQRRRQPATEDELGTGD
jgi:hypothetical protein